jgi:putative two-component system response regulator
MPDQPRRILIVDDEAANRELLEDLLVPLGYEIFQAADGATALAMVQEIAPDVILQDIMMPRMNGFEVVKRLKESEATRDIPVVVVTALDAVTDRIKALEAGASDFLAKPVDRVELQATVNAQIQVKAYHDYLKYYQQQLEAEVARRTEQLRGALEKLNQASLDTIMRLARAAEYKDEETGAHIQRMSGYSAAIARKLALGDNVAKTILYAAPMHDVGKIGIPERILQKPGKLNPEEWEIMKQHTIIGGQILQGAKSGYLKVAEVIALTHHERWDGTGYPRGLKGKAIPLAGQIAAIADVFDALTSKRPYKEAFTIEKAFAIIKESSGSHFNPDVVAALFAVKDEFISIKREYFDK